MIGLDTNVLLRYVLKDDRAQYAVVKRLIDSGVAGEESFLVGNVVLCEFVWVLSKHYRYTRAEISRTLEQILSTEGLVFEDLDTALGALTDYQATTADFADGVIGRTHRRLDAVHTATFDRDLKALDTFRVLS
jgi:predicted nucleic-acid-binding protein